jgi:hypothetical protein
LFASDLIRNFISIDIDPKSPSIFDLNIQRFTTNDTEILDITKNVVAYYKCKQCIKAKFFEYKHYKRHVFMVHQLNFVAAVFTCDLCFATFTVQQDLKLHTSKFHGKMGKYMVSMVLIRGVLANCGNATIAARLFFLKMRAFFLRMRGILKIFLE